jgi:hypothetical protein
VSVEAQIAALSADVMAKITRQYDADAEVVSAGLIVRVKNPKGPASTHYRFVPGSPAEAVALLDETARSIESS